MLSTWARRNSPRDVVRMVRDPEFRKDLERTRWWREFTDAAIRKGFLSALGLLVAAVMAAIGF